MNLREQMQREEVSAEIRESWEWKLITQPLIWFGAKLGTKLFIRRRRIQKSLTIVHLKLYLRFLKFENAFLRAVRGGK
jgi:hypothetical protein